MSDLGNSRLEILWTFTDHYLAETSIDTTHLPFWDLVAALHPCGRMSEWGLDAEDEARMRELHGWFVEQGLMEL